MQNRLVILKTKQQKISKSCVNKWEDISPFNNLHMLPKEKRDKGGHNFWRNIGFTKVLFICRWYDCLYRKLKESTKMLWKPLHVFMLKDASTRKFKLTKISTKTRSIWSLLKNSSAKIVLSNIFSCFKGNMSVSKKKLW